MLSLTIRYRSPLGMQATLSARGNQALCDALVKALVDAGNEIERVSITEAGLTRQTDGVLFGRIPDYEPSTVAFMPSNQRTIPGRAISEARN